MSATQPNVLGLESASLPAFSLSGRPDFLFVDGPDAFASSLLAAVLDDVFTHVAKPSPIPEGSR